MPPAPEYDHGWPTCEATFASVCLYHDFADPATATAELDIEPSTMHRAGARIGRNPARFTRWTLSSQHAVESRDLRAHLDYLLTRLNGRAGALSKLTGDGWRGHVSVFWSAATVHGGPALDTAQMAGFATLGLGIEFDLYLAVDEIQPEAPP